MLDKAGGGAIIYNVSSATPYFCIKYNIINKVAGKNIKVINE